MALKSLVGFIAASLGVFMTTGCSSAKLVNCAEVDVRVSSSGICETVGTVYRPEDGSYVSLALENGVDAGISLSYHPEIITGDRIYIRANYYVSEQTLMLVRNTEIRLIEEVGD